MAKERRVEFKNEDEGIWLIFTFPEELENIFIEEFPVQPVTGKRPLIKVRLFKKDSSEKEEKYFGDKGFDLKVFFIERDFVNAGRNKDELDIVYQFDGKTNWESTKEKHKLKIDLYNKPVGIWWGHGTAKIKKWEDPVIAWGG